MTIAGLLKIIMRVCHRMTTLGRAHSDAKSRPDARPDATGRDPRAIYLAEEAARSRARRAAKKAIKTIEGAAEPSDRTRPDAATGRDRTRPDAPHKEDLNIKREAHPIPEDWKPDADGYQLGVQAFGADGVEAAIEIHRDTWLCRPERLTDKQWQSCWSAWCRKHIAPGLPFGPQLATRRGRQRGAGAKPNGGTPLQSEPEPDDPLWTPVRQRLVAELREAVVTSWFRGARLELADGTATLLLPTKFHRQYVENNFDGAVTRAIAAVHGTVPVTFAVKPPDQQQEASHG